MHSTSSVLSELVFFFSINVATHPCRPPPSSSSPVVTSPSRSSLTSRASGHGERKRLTSKPFGRRDGHRVLPGQPGGSDRGRLRRRGRRSLRDPRGGEAQGAAPAQLLPQRSSRHRRQLQVHRLGGPRVRRRVRAAAQRVRDLPRQQEQRDLVHAEEGGQAGRGEQEAESRAPGGGAGMESGQFCTGLIRVCLDRPCRRPTRRS